MIDLDVGVTVLSSIYCVAVPLGPAVSEELICVVGVDYPAVSIIGIIVIVDPIVVVVPFGPSSRNIEPLSS